VFGPDFQDILIFLISSLSSKHRYATGGEPVITPIYRIPGNNFGVITADQSVGSIFLE